MPVISNETTGPVATRGTGGLLLLCHRQQDAKS